VPVIVIWHAPVALIAFGRYDHKTQEMVAQNQKVQMTVCPVYDVLLFFIIIRA